MQPPNCGNRNDQNHEITDIINDAGTDKDVVLVEAVLSPGKFVGFAGAFGRNSHDGGERIEEVPVKDKPDARVGVRCSSMYPLLK